MLGDGLESVGPLAADVAIGAEQHARVAEERPDPADRLGSVVVEPVPAELVARDQRCRQVGRQMIAHSDRAGTRAAAAVRAGEGLVRVVVHEVDPHVAGPDDAQDGVHVGAVEIEQGTAVVDQPGDLANLGVEEAGRIGVGDHEHGRLIAELGFEVVEIDQATAVTLDRDRFEAGQMCGGRVGAVGTVGNQNLGAPLAPFSEIGRGDEERRQLPLCAGRRLQADRVQSGDLGQNSLQLEQNREQSLERCLVLVRVLRAEARERGQPLVPLGVVLHRARAKRIEVGVDRHVERRQIRVMADDVELPQLGQGGRPGGAVNIGNERRQGPVGHVGRGQDRPSRGRGGSTRK